jgi:hypothetical protein
MIQHSYEQILRARYHGAGNHRAVLYHALFALTRTSELNTLEGPVSMICEGYEDVDLMWPGGRVHHIQLKDRKTALSIPDLKPIFRSFSALARANPNATFEIVASAGFDERVAEFASGKHNRSAPAKLRDAVRAACNGDALLADRILSATTFAQQALDELAAASLDTAHRIYNLQTSNEQLYMNALVGNLVAWAGQRKTFGQADIDRVGAEVSEAIARGTENPAWKTGALRVLNYDFSSQSHDYYQGRSARPEHVAASLDVRRDIELNAIAEVFKTMQVCVVLASSGQGKSTIALRYGLEFYGEGAVLQVVSCQSPSEAGAIAEAVENRLKMGVPILVFIDNLGPATREWHLLASRLSGQDTKFLVTSREEDWHRFGRNTVGFSWKAVRPALNLSLARNIFARLQSVGKIDLRVPSPEWAFEKVKDALLLIEYVYLITQGELLGDRLRQQVADITAEDAGKAEALRLISVADVCRVSLAPRPLLDNVHFVGDADMQLHSLIGEYIDMENGELHGLHAVRSRHLVDLLHPFGIDATVEKLCNLIDPRDLPKVAQYALSEGLKDSRGLVEHLCEHILEADEPLVMSIWEALYTWEETCHFRDQKPLLEEVAATFGSSGIFLLSSSMAPRPFDITDSLVALLDAERLGQFRKLQERILPRHAHDRLDDLLVTSLLDRGGEERASRDAAFAVELLECAHMSSQPEAVRRRLPRNIFWQAFIWDLPLDRLCSLCLSIRRLDREAYDAWLAEHRSSLVGRFKQLTESLDLREDGATLTVRYHVQIGATGWQQNVQDMTRVDAMAHLFPNVEIYATDPVYSLGDDEVMGEAKEPAKAIPKESMHLEEDVRLNRIWGQIMGAFTAADGLVIWEDKHFQAFSIARRIIAGTREMFASRVRGTSASQRILKDLDADLLAWCDLDRTMPNIPMEIAAEELKSSLKGTTEWTSTMGTVVNQSFSALFENPADDHNDHLLSINTRAAVHLGPSALDGLATARRWAGLDPRVTNWSSFAKDLEVLESLLGYLRSSGAIGPMHLEEAERWTQDQESAVLAAIDRGIERLPLEESARVIRPTRILRYVANSPGEFAPIDSVVMGLQGTSWRSALLDCYRLVVHCASEVPNFFGYLYACPLTKNQRVGYIAARGFAVEIASASAQNKLDLIKLFPVELKAGKDGITDRFDLLEIPEQGAIDKFITGARSLASAVAALLEGEVLLDKKNPFELAYLNELRDVPERLLAPFGETSEGLATLAKSGSNVHQKEWQAVTDGAKLLLAQITERPTTFLQAVIALQDPILEYLDLAYPLSA